MAKTSDVSLDQSLMEERMLGMSILTVMDLLIKVEIHMIQGPRREIHMIDVQVVS
jgi:hypothetical protein